MRVQRLCVPFLAAFCVLAASALADANSAFKQLEGRWKLVAVEKAGQRMPDEIVKQVPGQIVFADGKIRGMVGDKQVYEANFTVDASKSPKTYEMSGAKDRKGRDITTRGIWEIDDKGQLRKCFNKGADAKPPKSFNTKDTPGSELVIYERVK